MAGLDATGLTIKRFPEVLADLVAQEQTNIHPDINTNDNEFLGQINNITSLSGSQIYELVQAVYSNFIIDSAEAKNLDDLAALRNITRISASKSYTDRQQVIAPNGTTVSANTIFTNPITEDRFINPSAILVDASSCLSADMTVKQVLNSTEYSIQVNSTEYTYTSDGTATATEILTDFDSQITADTNATWSSSLAADVLTISSDSTTPISIITITYIGADSVTVEGYIESEVTGAVIAPANSINNFLTPVSGATTTNITQVVLGREEETDEELRDRIKNGTSGDCTGTIPSIEASILSNVTGVTSATATENYFSYHVLTLSGTTGTFLAGETITGGTSGAIGYINEVVSSTELNVTVLGEFFQEDETLTGSNSAATATLGKDFPPHSYEVVVVGGSNTEIGEDLWRTKPAGIRYIGNTSIVINDSNGNSRTVYFTRPTIVNFAVNVMYTRYDEESFPVTGEDTIRETILDHINNLGIDVDVIPKRMYGPIYTGVGAGIDDLVIEIQVIANPSDAPVGGSWVETSLPVESDQYASTTSLDIYITDAT